MTNSRAVPQHVASAIPLTVAFPIRLLVASVSLMYLVLGVLQVLLE